MIGPVITCRPTAPLRSGGVVLLGQAPGRYEGKVGRPFGWTAGRTLFRWLAQAGHDETTVRAHVYIAAVCRCFPGSSSSGSGDRVPDSREVAACAPWLDAELGGLDPDLLIPVGRLALSTWLDPKAPLETLVGRVHTATVAGRRREILPLPHPSGVSTWFQRSPGRERLAEALDRLAEHRAWRDLVSAEPQPGTS